MGLSSEIFFVVVRVITVYTFVFGFSHGQPHFCPFLIVSRFLAVHCLEQVQLVVTHGFPLWSFDSLENGVADGV